MSHMGSKSEVFLPARHVRCTLKSGRRQAQAEVHSIAHVSSHPYPAQLANALACSRACSRVRISGRSRLLGRSSQ